MTPALVFCSNIWHATCLLICIGICVYLKKNNNNNKLDFEFKEKEKLVSILFIYLSISKSLDDMISGSALDLSADYIDGMTDRFWPPIQIFCLFTNPWKL